MPQERKGGKAAISFSLVTIVDGILPRDWALASSLDHQGKRQREEKWGGSGADIKKFPMSQNTTETLLSVAGALDPFTALLISSQSS